LQFDYFSMDKTTMANFVAGKHRIAVVDTEKCQPRKCRQECQKRCPVQMGGKECVIVDKKASIVESNCIGCGMCVKTCPFKAIKITQVPAEIREHLIFGYGKNAFRLYKLPCMSPNHIIMGLVGENGTSKSTILKLLTGKMQPNFGSDEVVTREQVMQRFRGTTMQQYFSDLYSNKLSVAFKPQNISLCGNRKVRSLITDVETFASLARE